MNGPFLNVTHINSTFLHIFSAAATIKWREMEYHMSGWKHWSVSFQEKSSSYSIYQSASSFHEKYFSDRKKNDIVPGWNIVCVIHIKCYVRSLIMRKFPLVSPAVLTDGDQVRRNNDVCSRAALTLATRAPTAVWASAACPAHRTTCWAPWITWILVILAHTNPHAHNKVINIAPGFQQWQSSFWFFFFKWKPSHQTPL